MNMKIKTENPNDFERVLIEAAGGIWCELIARVPIEVGRSKKEATYLAALLEPDNRTYHRKIRRWWKISGVWNRLPEIRRRRLVGEKEWSDFLEGKIDTYLGGA